MWTYPFSRYRCTTSGATEDEGAASSVVISRSAFLYGLDVASPDNQNAPRRRQVRMTGHGPLCGVLRLGRNGGGWRWLVTLDAGARRSPWCPGVLVAGYSLVEVSW